jgi:hypothetical protein
MLKAEVTQQIKVNRTTWVRSECSTLQSLCWVLMTSFIRSIPWTTLIAQALQLYMPPLQVDVFRFNAAKSFCQRTFASSKVQQAPCPMFGVNGWEASPASVNPSHTCDELSCEFMLYLRELLTMFSIDVFSIHRKVGQDHPCMSFRASTLNNVRSFDEPAAQPTLGKRTLA